MKPVQSQTNTELGSSWSVQSCVYKTFLISIALSDVVSFCAASIITLAMILIYKVEIHNGGTWFCSREVSRSPRRGGGGGGGARGGGPPGNDDDGPGGGGGSPNTEGRHGPGGRGGACNRDVGGVSPAAGTPPAGDRGPAGGGAGDRDVGGNAAGAGAPPAGAPPAETGAPPAIVCELGSSNGVAIQTDPLMGLMNCPGGAPGDSVDSVESTDSNTPTSSSQESLDSQKTSTPNSQRRLLAQTSSITGIPGSGPVGRKWTLKSQLSENGVPESLEMGSWSQNSEAFDVSVETLCMGCREDMA
jgi:hypothetical protein